MNNNYRNNNFRQNNSQANNQRNNQNNVNKKYNFHVKNDDQIPIKLQFSDSFKNNEVLKKVQAKLETQTSNRNQACQKSRHNNNFRLQNSVQDTDASVKTEVNLFENNQAQEFNYEEVNSQHSQISQTQSENYLNKNNLDTGYSQFDKIQSIPTFVDNTKFEFETKLELNSKDNKNNNNDIQGSIVIKYNSLIAFKNTKQINHIQNQIVFQKSTYQFDKENSKLVIDKEQIPKLILIIPNKDLFEICDPKEFDLKEIVDTIKFNFIQKFDNEIRIVFLWVGAHDTINAQKSRNELKGEPLRWTADIFNRKQMDNFIQNDIEFQNFSGTKEFVVQLENILQSMVKVEEQQDQKYKKTKTHGHFSTMIESIKDEVQLLWIDMLMQIPGVTEHMAVAISNKYKTMGVLQLEWVGIEGKVTDPKKQLTAKMEMLKDLDQTNPNQRDKLFKVGKKVSRRIQIVFNETDTDRILDD